MKFKLCNRVKVITTGTLTGIYAQMGQYLQLQWGYRPEEVFINLANIVTSTGRPRKKFANCKELIELLQLEGVEYIAFSYKQTTSHVSIYCKSECSLDLTKLGSSCVTYLGICNDIDLTQQVNQAILDTQTNQGLKP